MARWFYRYAPILHRWNGSERYVGVLVHAPETGFFEVALLDRGDLMRRLWDVPRKEIDRLCEVTQQLEQLGRGQSGEPGLLERLNGRSREAVVVGAVHDGATHSLPRAVEQHFNEYAHPEIAEIG